MVPKRALTLVFSLAVAIACSAQSAVSPQSLWGSRTGTPGNKPSDLSKGSINWAPDLATAQAEAIRTSKLILLHFKGEKCPPCERVEKKVFSQSNVAYQINNRFVPVQINATAHPHIARQFEVTSWPTDLVLTSDGQELHRTTSPQSPRDYLAELGKSVWRAQNLLVAQRTAAPTNQPAQYAAAQQYAAASQRSPVAQIPNQMPTTGHPNIAQTSAQGSLPYPPTNTSPARQPAAFLPRTSSRAPGTERFAKPTPQQQAQASQMTPMQTAPSSPFAQPTNGSIETGQRKPNAPARNDLYAQDRGNIQLQGHAPAGESQSAHRIASHAPSSAVQQTSHNTVPLPDGQNPFGPGVNNGQTGPAMLNNPFSRQTPTAPAPAVAAPPQYQVANATQPAQTIAIQPQLNAIQRPAMQAPAQVQQPSQQTAPTLWPPTATPTPPAARQVVGDANPAPTPALTVAVPPAAPTQTAPSLAGPSTIAQSSQPENTSDQPENVVMDGFCPVVLLNEERWVSGDPRWGAQHRGKVFLFSSKTAQQEFLTDPDKYSPLLSGYDPVVFHETGRLSTGLRAHGVRYQNMTCLFSSEESLQRFWKSPWLFTQSAKQAMRTDTHVR